VLATAANVHDKNPIPQLLVAALASLFMARRTCSDFWG
jgi:hypothetical protein